MVVFCALGLDFFRSARKHASYAGNKAVEGGRVNLLVFGLVFSSAWILVRCIYRTIELAQGVSGVRHAQAMRRAHSRFAQWTGYLITHQPYFLVLDSTAMVVRRLRPRPSAEASLTPPTPLSWPWASSSSPTPTSASLTPAFFQQHPMSGLPTSPSANLSAKKGRRPGLSNVPP